MLLKAADLLESEDLESELRTYELMSRATKIIANYHIISIKVLKLFDQNLSNMPHYSFAS